MSEITIGNRKFEATVLKVKAGSEDAALSAMRKNGVNDVAFTIGGDTFIASGRDLPVQGVDAWQAVSYGGAVGRVREANVETLKRGHLLRWGLIGVAVGVVSMTLGGLGLGALMTAIPTLGELASMAGMGAVVFGALGAGVSALTNGWNGRQAGGDRLAEFAARD